MRPTPASSGQLRLATLGSPQVKRRPLGGKKNDYLIMITLDSLLYRGYFPIELPPAFITESFTNAIISNPSNLPAELQPSSVSFDVCHAIF